MQKRICFKPKDLRGSRLRCLILTSIPREQVALALTAMVHPFAAVHASDRWKPGGFLDPKEAKLGETVDFLDNKTRKDMTGWWLKVKRGANTPNWDIVSTCTMANSGYSGLILVEAKAHSAEMKVEGKRPGNAANDDQIKLAITEANTHLNKLVQGWQLSRDSHYQLCNRFAWAWKIASMGVPVILVYLGFLHADEMTDCGKPFGLPTDWSAQLKEHGNDVVPHAAWERVFDVAGTPLVAVVRAADIQWAISTC